MNYYFTDRKSYFPPSTELKLVRAEGGFMISSAEPAGIDAKNTKIEVNEYKEVWNEITFE